MSASDDAPPVERRPPAVELVIRDPKTSRARVVERRALVAVLSALVAALATSAAALAFLPWYRTPTVDDSQPCNCRGPVKAALEGALTEALLVELGVAVVVLVVVFVALSVVRRGRADG